MSRLQGWEGVEQLEEITCNVHLMGQVREAVGSLICKLGANLALSSNAGQNRIKTLGQSRVHNWSSVLVEGAKSAAATVQSNGVNLGKASSDDTSSDNSKEALKRIETVRLILSFQYNHFGNIFGIISLISSWTCVNSLRKNGSFIFIGTHSMCKSLGPRTLISLYRILYSNVLTSRA